MSFINEISLDSLAVELSKLKQNNFISGHLGTSFKVHNCTFAEIIYDVVAENNVSLCFYDWIKFMECCKENDLVLPNKPTLLDTLLPYLPEEQRGGLSDHVKKQRESL